MASQIEIAEARTAFERGEHARVRELLRTHALHPQAPAAALLLLGNSAIALGDDALALQALTSLHARQPQPAIARTLAGLHNRVGARWREAGREDEARAAFERALALSPGHRDAGFNLALALHALGRGEDAVARIDAQVAAHPDDAQARWLAVEWRVARAPAQAAALVDAASGDGVEPARLARVAFALQQADELHAARMLLEKAYLASGRGERAPGLRYALAARLALPPVMASCERIAQERARLAREVAGLEREWSDAHLARCEPALEQLAWSNFYLAYHGENDRALQEAYAALIERAARVLAPPFAGTPERAHPKRVAFVSSSFRDCTAGAYFGRWVDWLTDAGFETCVYQLGPQRDAVTDGYAQRAARLHFHDAPLLDLAQRVRADAPALVVYPELGMDARLLPLAALRLAPHQAMGWGHPVTSGLSTIDTYLSCAAMEPADGASHYREALVGLPGLGVDYALPPSPPPATRAELGLPQDVPLLLFPQSLFKIHPDNAAVLAELVRRVPELRIVVFEGEQRRWREAYLARQDQAVRAALHWLPLMPRQRYLQVNRACDLMLDTLHWSGGNTSLDALAGGLPVLTCPGATMRARQSHAMLGLLGLQESLSVPDPADLAPRAAALLRDPGERARLRAAIVSGLPRLFDPEPARIAFIDAVGRMVAPT